MVESNIKYTTENKAIVFPTLSYPTKNGKTKNFCIEIEIMAKKDLEIIAIKKFDNLLHYAKITTYIWTSNKERTESTSNYIMEGKNIGKKNETTTLEQAIKEVSAIYKKKMRKVSEVTKKEDSLIPPMLAMTLGVVRNSKPLWKKKIDYNNYIFQRKYDGIRVVTTLIQNKPFFYSRERIQFTSVSDKLQKEMYLLLSNMPKNSYIDGEFFKQKVNLQDIVSMVRNGSPELEIHIYDTFDKEGTISSLPYQKRYDILTKLFSTINPKFLFLVENLYVKSESEFLLLFDKIVNKENFEGIIMRNITEKYYLSVNNYRSAKALFKIKPVYSEEFEIVDIDFAQKGKQKDAIIFICKTKQDLTFKAVPKLTIEERKSKDFKDLIGKMLTVEYDELSNSGIPLHARAVIVRDYE